jgi:hypothetical protein
MMALLTISEVRGCDGFAFAFLDAADAFLAAGAGDDADWAAGAAASAITLIGENAKKFKGTWWWCNGKLRCRACLNTFYAENSRRDRQRRSATTEE